MISHKPCGCKKCEELRFKRKKDKLFADIVIAGIFSLIAFVVARAGLDVLSKGVLVWGHSSAEASTIIGALVLLWIGKELIVIGAKHACKWISRMIGHLDELEKLRNAGRRSRV